MDKFWYYGKDAKSGFEGVEEPKRENIHIRMERRVTELIQEVGIPAHIRGYHFLRTAILLVIDDPDIIHYMMNELYVRVAEQYHTTASRVERAIRFALTCAWDKLYFGEAKSDSWDAEYKPSNSEFIATVADKVKLEFSYISEPRYAAEKILKEQNK